MKKPILYLTIIMLIFFASCTRRESEIQIADIDFESEILGKQMQMKVYTPQCYEDGGRYPVLYFFPDYGGSVYTVMDQYGIAEKADAMIKKGLIEPIIIVAVDIDRSFGINSQKKVETVETESGKYFEKGMYEDYFIKEIVPYIDEKYNTISEKKGRFVGGYSMGGFAALHIAMRNFDMFSKSGGHSPSLFIESFPDVTVTKFLYPTDDIRDERDPIRLAQNFSDSNLKIFLDVESGGSDGVKYLYDLLEEKKMAAEYHVMSLSHSRVSCYENMEDYLLFYAGIENNK